MPQTSRRTRESRYPLPPFTKPRVPAAAPPTSNKTVWDKIGVLIQAITALAIVVPLVALYESVHQFNVQQTNSAAEMLNQQRQATLSGYLSDMSALVLQYNLPESKAGAPVRAIAVARTLTAVRNLDGVRKGTLIRYLWEARLIASPHPVVDISSADLTGAVFYRADLDGVALFQLSLNNAQFVKAKLIRADLSGSALFESDLINADLSGANLSASLLIDASLINADLTGADLTGADLTGADLRGARYNSGPEYVRSPHGDLILEGPTRWPRGFDAKAKGAICYNC